MDSPQPVMRCPCIAGMQYETYLVDWWWRGTKAGEREAGNGSQTRRSVMVVLMWMMEM